MTASKIIFLFCVFLLILAAGKVMFDRAKAKLRKNRNYDFARDLAVLRAFLKAHIAQDKFRVINDFIRLYDREADVNFFRVILEETEKFKHMLPERRNLKDHFDNVMLNTRTLPGK